MPFLPSLGIAPSTIYNGIIIIIIITYFTFLCTHFAHAFGVGFFTGSDILVEMEKGNTFIKLRNKKAYERFYYYNPQASTLCWFSRKSGGGVKSSAFHIDTRRSTCLAMMQEYEQ